MGNEKGWHAAVVFSLDTPLLMAFAAEEATVPCIWLWPIAGTLLLKRRRRSKHPPSGLV